MAWDEFERDGKQLMSGDDPIEELGLALRRIASAYEDRFKRLPYVDELLLSLERTLGVNPERFVEDPAGIDGARLSCKRSTSKSRQRLDFTTYEGYYATKPPPAHYGIERKHDREVITMPRFEVIERRLEIDYRILDDKLDDDSAIRLIKRAVLREFSDSYYADQADTLVFLNVVSGLRQEMAYEES